MTKDNQRKKLVERVLLDSAAVLFARNGFGGTTLQEIADDAGLSRTAMYHYFRSKDDVLKSLFEEFASGAVETIGEARAQAGLSHQQQLTIVSRRLALRVIENTARFRVLERDESSLPKDIADWHQKARRNALDALADLIADGVKAGEFIDVDPKVAALTVFGMCNWTARWYNPDASLSQDDIADIISQMVTRSIARTCDGASGSTSSDLLARIRSDLDSLSKLIP